MTDEQASKIQLETPTFRSGDKDVEAAGVSSSVHNDSNIHSSKSRRLSLLRPRNPKSPRLAESSPHRAHNDVYLGSYAGTTPRDSGNAGASGRSPTPSPRANSNYVPLERLLEAKDADLEGYGVEETRDGFFDPLFYRPLQRDKSELMKKAAATLPESFKKHKPLSIRRFLPQQFREAKENFEQICTTRAGVRLVKSFLGFFITYIICLIPASRDWLGRYNYIMVLSAIINHPGRAVGSQIDGAFMTILGTFAGLGWGSLALYVSTSTSPARAGYGGILVTFFVVFTAAIGWLRCIFVRFYQAVLCAGIAICYACLADASQTVGWRKVFDYGIPWVLGQAVCLLVSVLIFPTAGSRGLVLRVHDSLKTVQDGLALPRRDSALVRRRLAWQFVNVSQAVRDFTLEFTVSRFYPDDIRQTRNLLQSVIRSILAIRPDTKFFEGHLPANGHPISLICTSLRWPTRGLIDAMLQGIKYADSTIMKIGGQGRLNDPHVDPQNLSQILDSLQQAKEAFDSADALLVADPNLPSTYAKSPDVVELFLFVHPVRQAADRVEAFVAKVLQMQQKNTGWGVRAPSYPLKKGIMRTNAQVRHDRGGLTAGYYFRSKRQLDRAMADLQSTAYIPANRHESADDIPKDSVKQMPRQGKYEQEKESQLKNDKGATKTAGFRYRLWEILYRLQGFESRFAFKVTFVTTLISVPAWLPQSRGWWHTNESWWAVITVWTMMHPRVGGTFQDLAVRTFCAVIGAVWGGLAYAAGNGSPYVMAVFAAIYMIPMLHRLSQSSHPRSGTVGCISFTIVSLSIYTAHGSNPSVVTMAWTRGLAFLVGVAAALVVNWVLWPFIARHELRKSLSAMMLHSAILYRGVVAKYIYYAKGEEPGPEDIARSEMLEGRLREGFVRLRQLMELTRHEMRLRAPFDPLPYSALISTCESFFENLVQVRQSSFYFQPTMLASDPVAISSLTAPRRDAVAVILMNLYVLACALRADRPVPRYLPSAAAARQKLLDRMKVVEAEQARKREHEGKGKVSEERKGRRWADVYQYAYSGALTDIVEQLQELQRYTKEVCGEAVWESDSLALSD